MKIAVVASEDDSWLVVCEPAQYYRLWREYVESLTDSDYRKLLDFLNRLPRMTDVTHEELTRWGFERTLR